jgi:hypothetical protein
VGATGPQGPAGAGVASFDDLNGATCRVGEPQEGVLEISYGSGGLATMTCVATALQPLTVTVAEGPGYVTSTPAGIDCGNDCTESYPWGTSVELHATSRSGSVFRGWSGACTGTGTCTVAMDEVRNVTATFSPIGVVFLEVRNTLPNAFPSYGASLVTGPNSFTCQQIGTGSRRCFLTAPAGQPVTLTAIPAPGDSFESWSGPCGQATSCTVEPTLGGVTLTATFRD